MRRSAPQGGAEEGRSGEELAPGPIADTLSSGMLTLEHAPAALGLATLAGDVLYLNSRAERLFDLPHGAPLEGHNLAELCTEPGQLAAVEAVARDGRERQLLICRQDRPAVVCKLSRVAGYGRIPTWLALAGLERDNSVAAEDAALDEAESMSIVRRLACVATWKMRVRDWTNWANNSIQWGEGVQPLLNLKPGGARVTARGYLDLVAREDREPLRATFERALQSKARCETIHRLTPRNGAPKVVLSRAMLVVDESGAPEPTLFGVVQDITGAVGGELRAYEKAAILDTIAANLEAPVYAVDRDLRYTYLNTFFAEAMRQVYGVDAVLGEKAYETVPDDTRRRTVLGHLRRALNGSRVVEEVPVRFDDSIVQRYELTYSPIKLGANTSGVTMFGVKRPSLTVTR